MRKNRNNDCVSYCLVKEEENCARVWRRKRTFTHCTIIIIISDFHKQWIYINEKKSEEVAKEKVCMSALKKFPQFLWLY